MNLVQFIADDAATALAQIHAQLGDQAVVVSVRPLPAEGVARFLPGRRRIEVVAGVPEAPARERGVHAASLPGLNGATHSVTGHGRTLKRAEARASDTRDRPAGLAWLEQAGLASKLADQLQQELERFHGRPALDDPEREETLLHGLLARRWKEPAPLDDGGLPRPHVFIGPPGSGKTTALCKWLTLRTLMEGRAAKVWRLDGSTANTAELLSIHCELLGVPLERFWSPAIGPEELLFVDLPGVETSNTPALTTLCGQLATLGMPRVHLVLNAAYEDCSLLAQWRAFAALEPEDVIFTHLDEIASPVKLWNFVFGTNCSIRFLSGGQKIPGEFRPATPALFLPL
jgi:flagellar biosynthesis protein FlhF